MNIIKIQSFMDIKLREAFKTYFKELGVIVRNWEGLFCEMDKDGSFAFILLDEDKTLGFILLQQISFASWFFEEQCGFIREFWINSEYRCRGYGRKLLSYAEDYLRKSVSRLILTTDTAEEFYLKMGYVKARGINAKNKDEVFVKLI